MHKLCPNPRNYLGRSFGHILEYLQTSRLPNIQTVILHINWHISGILVSICGFREYSCIFLGMKSERIFFDRYDYACGEKLVGLHINIQLLKKIKERGFYPREITLKVTYEE